MVEKYKNVNQRKGGTRNLSTLPEELKRHLEIQEKNQTGSVDVKEDVQVVAEQNIATINIGEQKKDETVLADVEKNVQVIPKQEEPVLTGAFDLSLRRKEKSTSGRGYFEKVTNEVSKHFKEEDERKRKENSQIKKDLRVRKKENLQKINNLRAEIKKLESEGKKGFEILAEEKEKELRKFELEINESDKFVKSLSEKNKTNLTDDKKDIPITEEAVEISPEDAEKIEKNKFSRAGSEITLSLIEKYEDLNALTEVEGDEKFKEKTRGLWKNFAVHGFLKKDEKGELYVDNHTDLDGKCSLELFKLAGFDKKALSKNLKYVAQGEKEEGYINIDTGGKHGIVIDGETFYIDHHDPNSPWGTSAAEFTYKMLVDMGLLEQSERLDKMVEFTSKMDNGEYPGIEKYFQNSWKTIAGMQRFLNGENLVKFFQKDKNPDPTRELNGSSDPKFNEFRKYGLLILNKDTDRSKQQEKIAKKSLERLNQMQEEGLIIPSERYGKIAVSIESGDKKDLLGDFLAARAFGCDAYINYNKKKNIFKISSKIPITEEYSQGMLMRETQWFKNIKDKSELTVPLEEILNKMTDGKLQPEGKLKKYFDDPEAFLKKYGFEKILGDEMLDKIIERMQKLKKEILENLEKNETWEKYDENTRNNILRVDVQESIAETAVQLLDIVIKRKNITEKIDEKEFLEYVLTKI